MDFHQTVYIIYIIIRFLINVQVQGQHPHQWAPFQAWQISHQISRYVYHEGWYPRASTLCNPSLSAASMSSWASHAHAFPQPVCERLCWLHHWSVPHVHPYQRSLLSFRIRSRSSMPSCASSSLDLVVTMSCCLTLQICLIIALSFRCRCWRFGFVNGQVSLAWSIVLCTQELYTWPCVLKERWQEERTGCRSLNFFQAFFTHVVVESSQPLAAESMSPW